MWVHTCTHLLLVKTCQKPPPCNQNRFQSPSTPLPVFLDCETLTQDFYTGCSLCWNNLPLDLWKSYNWKLNSSINPSGSRSSASVVITWVLYFSLFALVASENSISLSLNPILKCKPVEIKPFCCISRLAMRQRSGPGSIGSGLNLLQMIKICVMSITVWGGWQKCIESQPILRSPDSWFLQWYLVPCRHCQRNISRLIHEIYEFVEEKIISMLLLWLIRRRGAGSGWLLP